MFIVWGFKARKKTLDSGTFFCPRCKADHGYKHQMARRWFTLYWIPLVPLKELGDFVECQTCQSTFFPEILEESKSTGDLADISSMAIRHVVASMLRADGQVTDEERTAGLQVVNQFSLQPIALEDLEGDLADLRDADLTDKLEEFGAILSDAGREQVLSAAVRLSYADGDVDQSEINAVHTIGEAMSMTQAHVEGVISAELRSAGITL